ncbi:MAG TPA: YIP1 family protein [Bryobacterales bacterium]|nr:YIP1 family protein [Bryobacterales bacterium]
MSDFGPKGKKLAVAAAAERRMPLIDVFFSPVETMDFLASNPRFLSALLLTTVITILATTVAFERGVIERSLDQKIQADSRLQQLPEEEREAAIDRASRLNAYAAIAGAMFGPAAGLLSASGVLLVLVRAVGDTRTRFAQMAGIVAHSWLPATLSTLIAIPVLLLKDPESVDFDNIVPLSNLSFLFSPQEQRRLHDIGASLDLFSFWVIALLTLGVSRLSGKSKTTALVIVLAPWMLYIVVFRAL